MGYVGKRVFRNMGVVGLFGHLWLAGDEKSSQYPAPNFIIPLPSFPISFKQNRWSELMVHRGCGTDIP